MRKNTQKRPASYTVEFDREEDGRWIAEVRQLPGAMAYGATKQEAARGVHAIALRTLADSVEQGNTFTGVSRLLSARRIPRGLPRG